MFNVQRHGSRPGPEVAVARFNETQFGKRQVLAYLPKKTANFLHEFRAADFSAWICLRLFYPLIVAACMCTRLLNSFSSLLQAWHNMQYCSSDTQYNLVMNSVSLFCRFGLPFRATGTSGCSEILILVTRSTLGFSVCSTGRLLHIYAYMCLAPLTTLLSFVKVLNQ